MVKYGHYDINPDVQAIAWNDFGWKPLDIKKCLLKLNDRYHGKDNAKNHFHKSEPNYRFPGTIMDYYKAINIMQGFDVYTHFYIHPEDGKLVISSFKELEK